MARSPIVDLRGRAAYEAYCAAVGGWSVHDELLPDWDGLRPKIREAWREAGSTAALITDEPAEG